MSNNRERFYVIIGLGFSAVLNHLLLRTTPEGRKRVGKLSILHIGLPDPWGTYDIEQMGQWPVLLCLPSFSNGHTAEPAKEFLSSRAFATATQQELSRLGGDPLRGKVMRVVDNGDEFKIQYVRPDGREDFVLAEKIDVCTGPGSPKLLPPKHVADDDLMLEYMGAGSPRRQRRLMTGEEFLNRATVIPPNGRICICGEATAAWCVERALKSGARSVLWSSHKVSERSFPPSGRNDALIDSPPARFDGIVTPSDSRLRLAVGYEIDSIALAGGDLDVGFVKWESAFCTYYRGSGGIDLGELKHDGFDQVVVAIGQQDVKVPTFLPVPRGGLWHTIPRYLEPKLKRSGRNYSIGFSDSKDSHSARIRVLGSAGRTKPDDYDAGTTNNIGAFESDLPRQARGARIPSDALMVAWANAVFGTNEPNLNINTAEEMDLVLGGMDSPTAAARFVRERSEAYLPFVELPKCLEGSKLRCDYSWLQSRF